jgi:hypothetical protein
MGCFLAVVGLITPRMIMVILWLFTDYLSRAFHSFLWPLLGFFFLPTTTLAYAIANNSMNGLRGWGMVIVILGVLLDLGIIGGSRGRAARRRVYPRSP